MKHIEPTRVLRSTKPLIHRTGMGPRWTKAKFSGCLEIVQKISCLPHFLVGGWATPLKNMNVNWDDDIPNISGKINNGNQTTKQFQMGYPWLSHLVSNSPKISRATSTVAAKSLLSLQAKLRSSARSRTFPRLSWENGAPWSELLVSR